jgi:hypothetical protein
MTSNLIKETTDNKHSLSRLNASFDQIRGEKVFLKIDLNSRYHQIKMKDEVIAKVTFKR